jgi:hypothetical protein
LSGASAPPLSEPESETCRNHRLRQSRRKAWWAAHHLTLYWRASMDWHSALSIAQSYNVADANSYPKSDDCENRHVLVDLWRYH